MQSWTRELGLEKGERLLVVDTSNTPHHVWCQFGVQCVMKARGSSLRWIPVLDAERAEIHLELCVMYKF